MEKGEVFCFLPVKNKKPGGASSDLAGNCGRRTTVNRNSRQAFFCISTAYIRNNTQIIPHIYAKAFLNSSYKKMDEFAKKRKSRQEESNILVFVYKMPQ